jgi:hypothetical protein
MVEDLTVFREINFIIVFHSNMLLFAQQFSPIRIFSIPSTFCYFRPPDHVISMECSALGFRCQCTQQKLQSICAVLTFDSQLKKKYNMVEDLTVFREINFIIVFHSNMLLFAQQFSPILKYISTEEGCTAK